MKRATLVAGLILVLANMAQAQGAALSFRDDFNGSMSSLWQVTNEDSTKFSLSENAGFLRIHTTPTDVWDGHNDLVNLFTIPVQEGIVSFTVTAKIRFPTPPYSHPQQAGIILLGRVAGLPDMDNFVRLTYGYIDGYRRLHRAYETNGNPNDTIAGPGLDIGTNPIWIRIVKTGDSYDTYYSLDGTNFDLFSSFSASLPIAFIGFSGFHSEPYVQSIPVDFDYFQIGGVTHPPLPVDDTRSPSGAVHAYPNAVLPGNNLVTITLDGYVVDELSMARDGTGIGVSSAYLLVNGKKMILRASSDTTPWDGRFRGTIQILAKKNAVYKVELYASDTNPPEDGGPNSGLVDLTFIRVQ